MSEAAGAAAVVILKAVAGPHAGREFRFDRHDMFIFGRSPDCQCSVPDDPYLSGGHFLLEVAPPDCELRDLGSKNGTFVNGKACGRRDKGEAAEEAAGRARAVALEDGDVIEAGTSKFTVSLRTLRHCAACGKEVLAALDGAIGGAGLAGRSPAVPALDGAIGGAGLGAEGEPRCAACSPPAAPRGIPAAGARPAGPKARRGRGGFTDFLQGALKAQGEEKPPEFPGYRLERLLAEGGMGRVYLARREADGSRVVVKVVKPRGGGASAQQAKLFRREMSVASELMHPNIARVLETGCAGGVFFFAMEHCDGGSAAELASKSGGRLEVGAASRIVLQALEGLAHAHGRGLVHRDLKPENILLSGRPACAKLADFGLAKSFAMAGLSGMTASGAGGGTLPFMPKEQLKDYRGTKPVSDVFSMGASLYNLLTGQFVYDLAGCDPCAAILRDRIVPVRQRGVALPEAVADVVDRATLPDWRKRFQTASEFQAALKAAAGK